MCNTEKETIVELFECAQRSDTEVRVLLLGEDAFLPDMPRDINYLRGSMNPVRLADYVFDTVTGILLKHRGRRLPEGQITLASVGTGTRDEDVVRLSRVLLDLYPDGPRGHVMSNYAAVSVQQRRAKAVSRG